MKWTTWSGICVVLVVVLVTAENSAEENADNEIYNSISYSAPYPATRAKSVAYANSQSYVATPAPAPVRTAVAVATAPAAGGPGPGASGPGPTGGGPGPSGGGPGPSGGGPGPGGPSGPGPSGPGPFGPGPGGPGPFGFGPGPFGFGPGPFGFGPGLFPYGYGYPYGKGLLPFFLTKLKFGFKALENLLAPIGTITTLMSVLNFLKIKVVPKVVTKFHEIQSIQNHDTPEALTSARRYRRSIQELDDLTQRVLNAIDKNMCTEKLVCQIGKRASKIVSSESSWVNSTLGILKKIESPNSLISIFRQSISNLISNCDVIICKSIPTKNEKPVPVIESNDLDQSKTLLDEEVGEEEDEDEEEGKEKDKEEMGTS